MTHDSTDNGAANRATNIAPNPAAGGRPQPFSWHRDRLAQFARRLRWQAGSSLFPRHTARAFERAWFSLPAGKPTERSADTPSVFAQARQEWALVTGDGAPRRVRVYRWPGSGPTVLLAHGWGGQASQWRTAVPALLAAGYRVVAFDALSHGASDAGARGPGQSSLVEMSRSLLACAWHAGPVGAVIAHSLGAAATALAIREGLPVDAAVLIGPPADMARASARLAWQLGVTPDVLALTQRNSERWLGMPWSAFNVPDVGRCRPVPPTLVVHDRDDREVDWQDGAAIAGAWPGARLLTTEGLGHRRILHDAATLSHAVGFLDHAFAKGRLPASAHGGPRVENDRARGAAWHGVLGIAR